MTDRIEALLEKMTLEEKTAMTAGTDMWHGTGVPRLGIPALKVSDGPSGARGEQLIGGVTAACFPCGSALGASWNPELVQEVGQALGQELQTKGAHILLAPTVNIHRTPLAGRNFECYSEDPVLTARLAIAFIRGVQSQGVGTSIKHFVCNDSEFERHTISSEVDERPLREIYLLPFEQSVAEAKPWSVMSAYNRVNGTHASANHRLLTEILKDEWGFEGFVISDWFGTGDSVGIANGGLDLEMPGPARFAGEKLLEAVRRGDVLESTIDDKVRRLLRVTIESGALDAAGTGTPPQPERAVDRPEHREIARRAAAEAIVLLTNARQVLPLSTEANAPLGTAIRSLAVIGPNADRAVIQGGGSAHVPPHYTQTPLEAIAARCGAAVDVRHAKGCTNHKVLPELDTRAITPSGGPWEGREHGLTIEYFDNASLGGDPVARRVTSQSQLTWFGRVADGVDARCFSARLGGRFTAREDGEYTFALTSAGSSRLLVDGREVLDNWTEQVRGEAFFGAGSTEVTASVAMKEGETYDLEIQYAREGPPGIAGLRIGCLSPVGPSPIETAVALAAECDAAVLIAGLNPDWESEGHDRPDLELPGDQNELIERVAEVNPNTIVALNCGSPVRMPWLERVAATLQVWYGGQEAGNALADVLFGDRCPSGKLPTTFPRRLEDTPAFLDYPGENGRVRYGEGLYVGYRYYDARKIEPLLPFGHGLSYTRFAYADLTLSPTSLVTGDAEIEVALTVENTGSIRGAEVVQLYIRDVAARVARPEKELRAFQKVELAAGGKARVQFSISERALSFYDPSVPGWVAEPGTFEVLVGSSSRDIRLRGSFELQSR